MFRLERKKKEKKKNPKKVRLLHFPSLVRTAATTIENKKARLLHCFAQDQPSTQRGGDH
jgi:hypothetical protein